MGGRKQNEMGRKERVDNKFFVCRKSEMRYEGRKYNGHIILIGNSLALEVDATRGRRDSVSAHNPSLWVLTTFNPSTYLIGRSYETPVQTG